MQFGASTFLLLNGLEGTNLFPYVQVTMRDLIYRYEIENDAKRTVDIIQEYVRKWLFSGLL